MKNGFTLVELIVTLLLLSGMAAAAAFTIHLHAPADAKTDDDRIVEAARATVARTGQAAVIALHDGRRARLFPDGRWLAGPGIDTAAAPQGNHATPE